MFPKFVQLVSHDNELWALDDNGDVFYRDIHNRNASGYPVWRKSKTVREEEI